MRMTVEAIVQNKLRAILTLLGISIGVFSNSMSRCFITLFSLFLSVAFLAFVFGMLMPSLQFPSLFLAVYTKKFLSLLVGLLEMTLSKAISAERSIF